MKKDRMVKREKLKAQLVLHTKEINQQNTVIVAAPEYGKSGQSFFPSAVYSLQFRKVRRHSLFSPPFPPPKWRNQSRRERERRNWRPRPSFHHHVIVTNPT